MLQPSQVGQTARCGGEPSTAIEAAIMGRRSRPSAAPPAGGLDAGEAITLPVTIMVLPAIDSTKVAEMGIVEQVSEGTTYFAGSTRERVQNIVSGGQQVPRRGRSRRGGVLLLQIRGRCHRRERFCGFVDHPRRPHGNGRGRRGVPGFDHSLPGGVYGAVSRSWSAIRTAMWWAGTATRGWMPASSHPTADFRFRNDTGALSAGAA